MPEFQRTGPLALADVPVDAPEQKLAQQVLAFTAQLMLVRHVMQAGWQGARHSHPHEQLVYVVRGRVRLASGDSEFVLSAGDSFVVPGGTQHEAFAIEDAEVLDVFSQDGWVLLRPEFIRDRS